MKWTEELRRLLDRLRREPSQEEAPGGVSCQEAAGRLYEWLDGELDPEMGDRIGTHLETCARCYPVLRFERSFREAVARAVQKGKVPEELRESIMEQLEMDGFGS